MKVLLSWMQEFAPIQGDPHELAAILTDLGLVVESVASTGPAWDGIVVARVLGLRPHPEADRIQLVDVDTGGTVEAPGVALQICCGAFNLAVGDLVPLATLGSIMPGGLEIVRRKLRGEWSNGMLCASSELELEDDAEGIRILDPGLTVGRPLAEALGAATDWLFDIDVEGNRPDALSVVGVARDLAAKLGVPFSLPALVLPERAGPGTSDLVAAEIVDTGLCQRFGVRVLEHLTIGPSPAMIVGRLAACGMRSINNVVDLSNYVMLELGEPNHTYDLDRVPDGELRVRYAVDGEVLVTLDGQTRVLTSADGLICNRDDEPIGLAGVMGGAATEITEGTSRVLIEAAVWDRMTIARTSRRLNLRSEASTRFERGADPLGVERALDRFCALAVEYCGATVAPGSVVIEGHYRPRPEIALRVSRVNHLLNTELDAEQIRRYLEPIGFHCEPFESEPSVEGWRVIVPSWRPDASIEEDLIEEIGRHHGYSRSGKRVPTPSQNGELTPAQRGRRRIRRTMLGAGLSEAMPMPFLAPGDLAAAGLDDANAISLENPLAAEESILRTSLLPGLLKAVAYNQSHRNAGVQLFELGRVFLPGATGSDLPNEPEWVAGILADQSAIEATKLLHRLGAALGLRDLKVVNAARPGLHPTRSAELVFRGRTVGEVGEVDPRALDAYGVSGRVGWLALEVAPVLTALSASAGYRPVSNYPSSDIDLTFVASDSVAVSDLIATLSTAGRPLLQHVRFLNAFRSEQLGTGVRSLAFALRLQAADRTLTDADVAAVRQVMIDAVAKKNKAQLR